MPLIFWGGTALATALGFTVGGKTATAAERTKDAAMLALAAAGAYFIYKSVTKK